MWQCCHGWQYYIEQLSTASRIFACAQQQSNMSCNCVLGMFAGDKFRCTGTNMTAWF